MMEVDRCYTKGRLGSNEFDSVATAAQEVCQTWTFAPASQSNGQHSQDVDYGTPSTKNMSTHQAAPFAFRRRSRDATAQSSGDDSLSRARRQDGHQSTRRLLDPGHNNGHGTSRLVSDTLPPAHIPAKHPSSGAQDAHFGQNQVQRSQSHLPRSLLDQKPSSSHSKPFLATPRYHTPTHPRRTLSERLQEAQLKPSLLHEASSDLSQAQVQEPTSLAKHGVISSLTASAGESDSGTVLLELDGSESHVPVPNSKPNPCSRSVSVSSTAADARGMQGVVMEAMKTIQWYESETEIQKGEIDRLNTRIGRLEKEKEKLSDKVQVIKSASLQKLAASSQNLEALRLDVASLRSDYQASTCVSLADVQEMKETISHALKSSAKYLENQVGASVSGNTEKTREIINELKLDCMNKQQVLDMLRDRLSDALSDLATSKNRVFELEDAYAVDRLALKHATEQLAATSSRISELASSLKQEQKESVAAMTLAGDLEHQLQASRSEASRLEHLVSEFKVKAIDAASREHHISKLESLVDFQKDKIKLFDSTNKENAQLKTMVKEREERVGALEKDLSELSNFKERNTRLEMLLEEQACKQKTCDAELSKLVAVKDSAVLCNTQLNMQLHESESKSRSLESELITKSHLLDELQALMSKLQANFDASCQSIKTLEAELASSWSREAASRAAESSEKAQRLEETRVKTGNAQRLMEAEQQMQGLLGEAANFGKRLEEAETRCKSLQDRFEEQSITLRLARDTSAELQDRLIAAESGYAKDLEAKCGSFRTQIAVLQEQNTAVQTQLEQCKSDAEVQRKEYKAREDMLIQRIENAGKSSEVKCGELRTEIAVLREQNSALQVQVKETTLNLQAHRADSTKKEADLLQRIEDAGKEFDRELHRANSMKIQVEQELAEAVRRNDDLEIRLAGALEQLEVVPAPCKVHDEEIKRLKAQILRISSECDAMKERARSLNCRYNKGDLDPEERILIKTILNATQSMHVHELAETQNELNRSNKMISTLQDAKIMLENSLAKHLAAEANLKTAGAKASTSGMDYVNWLSPQPKLSKDPPAQDKDEPSTAPDDAPGEEGKRTPLPSFDPIQDPDSPDRPLASTVRFLTPSSGSLSRNFAPPYEGTSKGYFSTLAQDQSDEIGEFDETFSAKRKKVQWAHTTGEVETSKPAKRPNTKLPEQSNAEAGTTGTTKTTYKSKRKRR